MPQKQSSVLQKFCPKHSALFISRLSHYRRLVCFILLSILLTNPHQFKILNVMIKNSDKNLIDTLAGRNLIYH